MIEFLIAIAAGFAAPHLEAPVAAPVARKLQDTIKLEPGEMRVLALLIAMIGGAVLISLIGDLPVFGFAVGIGLGYFGTRLVAMVRKAVEGKKPETPQSGDTSE